MAIHVHNVSAMLLRSETPGCLTHATATELRLDGSILKNARLLLVTLNLMDASAKVLRHAENQSKETCLAEFRFGISMDVILVAQGPLSVEKLDFKMSQTSSIINDSFYNMAHSNKINQKINQVDHGEDDFLQRILPLIPKVCYLQIDDTSLKGVKDNSQIEYNSTLKKLSLTYRSNKTEMSGSSPQVSFNFFMADLQLQNSREKLLSLKTLNVDAKLKSEIVNIYFQMNSLLIMYNHDVIHRWVHSNFLKNKQNPSLLKLKEDNSPGAVNGTNGNSLIENIVKKLVINVCAEFSQVSATVKLSGHSSSMGFNHVKLMLEQAQKRRGPSYNSYFFNLLLLDRHWQTECLIESFWWSFKEWNQDSNVSKKMHIWGTPVYFVKVLVKVCTHENHEMEIASFLDMVQLEWSLELADWVLLAIKCFKQYGLDGPKNSTNNHVATNFVAPQLYVNMVINHFNCFFQSQNTEYFVTQLNSVEIIKNLDSTNVQFEEFKIFTINNTGAYYCCIRTEDISNYKVFVKHAQVDYKSGKNTINLLEEITVYWSTNFHLKALLLVRDITEFLSELREELNLALTENSHVDDTTYNCTVMGLFAFHIEISEKYSGKVSIDTLNVSKRDQDLSVQNNTAVISIDGADIFTIKGINLHRVKDNKLIRDERLDNENFKLAWNKTWGLSVDLFKAVFPYEHNYADAVQNEFVSVFKWLKIVHNRKKIPFTASSPLPSDLFINVKEFLFEMSDDPFEVKLRDNFELLEDEYNESLKRQKMLKEKVAELCKTHLHLPAGKVEELYNNLKKKNAEIYIQRSKQMLRAVPPRTRLFAWNMTNMEIMVLDCINSKSQII
jgi:hypothetical protein